jgi:GntR family transcriptional regulator
VPEQDHTGRQRVVDDLIERIDSGDLPAGAKLPSLTEIAAAYSVSRDTAQKAVDAVVDEGLVNRRHGSGNYVRDFLAIPRESPGRLSRQHWLADKAIQDADTGSRPRDVEPEISETPAPEWVAAALGIEPGSTVVCRDRLFFVDQRPVQIAISYIPVDLARGTPMAEKDTGPGGTYRRLTEVGHMPVRFVERVLARLARRHEAQRLNLPPLVPVIQITRAAFDEADRCCEINRMVLDSSAYELIYKFDS